MAKANRGKQLFELPRRGRGKCPSCGRTGIKLLYEVTLDSEKTKVCKNCRKKK